MKIQRTLDTTKAIFDLLGLTKEQFDRLAVAYEKQMYIFTHQHPDESNDELLKKLREMQKNHILTI